MNKRRYDAVTTVPEVNDDDSYRIQSTPRSLAGNIKTKITGNRECLGKCKLKILRGRASAKRIAISYGTLQSSVTCHTRHHALFHSKIFFHVIETLLFCACR